MSGSKNSEIWLITGSCLLALLLNMTPLPAKLIWFRPEWLAMALIYWSIVFPYRMGLGVAWLLGLLVDILNGTLLGDHALALAFIVYLVTQSHRQLKVSHQLQQALSVFAFIMIYQALLFWVQAIVNKVTDTRFWLSALTSMLIWPLMVIVLNHLRRRYKLHSS